MPDPAFPAAVSFRKRHAVIGHPQGINRQRVVVSIPGSGSVRIDAGGITAIGGHLLQKRRGHLVPLLPGKAVIAFQIHGGAAIRHGPGGAQGIDKETGLRPGLGCVPGGKIMIHAHGEPILPGAEEIAAEGRVLICIALGGADIRQPFP